MDSACAEAAFPSAALSSALNWSVVGIAHADDAGLGVVVPALAEITRAHSRRHCCVAVEKVVVCGLSIFKATQASIDMTLVSKLAQLRPVQSCWLGLGTDQARYYA